MINSMLLAGSVVLLILFLEKKNLKKATKSTWIITIGLLLVSAAIWVYIQTDPNHVYPSMWLNFLLEPFDPIS
ncbi:hypothetical protein CU633_01660 [Bacillus sp. V3-13]|uniref:hypothetical protein n=1 Tax=Bacillus sp. V3-13 TaxID=2053728 RepID=UPI000C771776|nr:hypothetical protein [Bacillus sp. V3-13]PLR79104.1 hypothetical protein CU633_01660 [Bacillus sp. V3-13]